MEVSRTEGYGLLHTGVSPRHEELVSSSNSEVALWAQDCARFDLDESAMVDNEVAGVVLYRVEEGRIDDTNIGRTVLATRSYGAGEVTLGDGMHLVEVSGPIRFEDTTLADNERVGLLVDLGGRPLSDVVQVFHNLDVEGRDSQYGVIVQNGEITEGWDATITRSGAPIDNDPAFTGALSVVGPLDLGFISVESAFSGGFEGVVGDF
jgi:hypothetical protein